MGIPQAYLDALLPDHDRELASAMAEWHAGGRSSHFALERAPIARGDLAQIDDIYARWKLEGLATKHHEQVVDIELDDAGAVSDIERIVKRGSWTTSNGES